MILTLEHFLSYFPPLSISKDDFVKKMIVTYKNNPTLYDLFNFKTKIIKTHNDRRYILKDEIIDYLYDVIIVNRHVYLTAFYYSYFEFVDPYSLKWGNEDIIHKTSKGDKSLKLYLESDEWIQGNKEILFEKILDMDKLVLSMQKNDASRRLVRNLNFMEILHTTKVTNTCKCKTSFWESLTDVYNKLILADRMFAPSSLDQFLAKKNKTEDINYNAFFYLFQGYQPKASILNPYTISWILNNILKGKKLFTPVLSWCSYLFAFFHSSYTHYVGVDVIPEVIDQCRFLEQYYKKEKYVDLYCTPSESLLNNKEFNEKYTNYFDAILMCPPYFNMEIYEGDNQSIKLYPTYDMWLEEYWHKTVKLCYNVLEKNYGFNCRCIFF